MIFTRDRDCEDVLDRLGFVAALERFARDTRDAFDGNTTRGGIGMRAAREDADCRGLTRPATRGTTVAFRSRHLRSVEFG
jgi:hypothetical protein